MKWLNSNRMRLLLVGIVAAMVVGGTSAKADFTFGEPTILESPINEEYMFPFINCISADNLELYLDRPSGPWNNPSRYDIKVSTRATTNEPWPYSVNLGAAVNNGYYNYDSCISNDGLKLYFVSNRPGGHGIFDIWVTTRPYKGAEWGTPVNLVPPVNTSDYDGHPHISSDGLEFYFDSDRPGGSGGGDIWVAKRQTQDDNWGTPENLGPLVNKSGDDYSPCLSPNGLVLFFKSDPDMWMTRRKSTAEPWESPMNLGMPLNSSDADYNPTVSPDGRLLYFTSHREGVYKRPNKGWHIWQATIIPIVDFNGDDIVDSADMCIMVDHWGENYSLCDIGPMPWGDGIVDVQDLIVLAEHLFEEINDPTLIAHWPLDEAQGVIAYDSAADCDGTLMGGPVWKPDDGMADGALQFDGIDDYVSTDFVLDPVDGPFSVFAWVKDGASGQIILSQEGGVNWLMADSVDGALQTDLKERATTGRNPKAPGPPLISSTVVTDGDWHRVGFVRDGIKRILYVDDVDVACDTAANLEVAGGGLYIGAGSGLEPGTFFSGLIDDIRIYNRAVSP